MNTADAILRTLESPNVPDSNMENANVVDALASLAHSTRRIALAIKPNAAAGKDATGGVVDSLTESVMGITEGLVQIAQAIRDLADAVREHGEEQEQ